MNHGGAQLPIRNYSVQIEVADRRLKAALEDDAVCRRRFGTAMTKYVRLRVDALAAAASLYDFWPPKSKPERVHELKGDLAGIFSVDVKQPYRLLFRPTNELPNAPVDMEARWKLIRSIEILKVEDTHG
jgi:proteic killer suppression protein